MSRWWRGLWPKQEGVPPPRADGTLVTLEAAVLAQLGHLLEALPSWDGVVDAQVMSRCTYGHTHVELVVTRTDELAAEPGRRLLLARTELRQLLVDYCRLAVPGSGWERERAIGDSTLEMRVRWVL